MRQGAGAKASSSPSSSSGLAAEFKPGSPSWEPKHLRALLAQLCGPLREEGGLEYFTRPDHPEVNTLAYASSTQTFYSLVRTNNGKHRIRFVSLDSPQAKVEGDFMVVSPSSSSSSSSSGRQGDEDALEVVGALHSITPSASGKLLLITGPSFVGVVEVQGDARTRARFVLVRVLEEPGHYVRKAAWHPLAPHTVVVLRDRPRLEFWDVRKTDSSPQIIRLAGRQQQQQGAGAGGMVMSFCFGPPRLWHHFTIYLLCDRENHGLQIKALCPVILEGARVEATAMLQLQDQVSTLLLYAQRDPNRGGAYVAQMEDLKKQLVACFGDMRKKLEDKADNRSYMQHGWVEAKSSLISSDNRPVAIQTVSLSERVLGRKRDFPRCTVNDMKLVSPATLPEVAVVAVSWCIGTEVEVEDHSYLDIYALLGDIQPRFHDRGSMPQRGDELEALERLTTGLEAYPLAFFSLGKHDVRSPHFPPRVFNDNYRPGVLYIVYAGKLMVAHVGGIPALIDAVQGPWKQEKRFNPTSFIKELSENELVINDFFDAQRVVGAALVADVVLGHVLVCREEKETLAHAINLSLIPYMEPRGGARDGLLLLSDGGGGGGDGRETSTAKLALEAEQRGYKPLEDHIRRLEKTLEEGMSGLSARRMDGGQQDEVLLQEQEEVTYGLLLPARELLNRAMYREKDLLEVYKLQKAKAEELLKSLKEKEKAWATLEEETRKSKDKNQSISEVSLASLSLLKDMQRQLSPQERRELKRLAQYKAQVDNLENKLQVIRRHLEKTPPMGPDVEEDEIKDLERLAEKQWQAVQRVKHFKRTMSRRLGVVGEGSGDGGSGALFDLQAIQQALPTGAEDDSDRPPMANYLRDDQGWGAN